MQDRLILHYGDLAIAIYRGVVSGDRQLQGLSPARVNVGEGQALALRQQTEADWRAGVCPPRVFFALRRRAGPCANRSRMTLGFAVPCERLVPQIRQQQRPQPFMRVVQVRFDGAL